MPLRHRRRPGWTPTIRQRLAWALAAGIAIALEYRRRSPAILEPRLRWDRSPQAHPITDVATSTYRR